jgi:hypothetical protein
MTIPVFAADRADRIDTWLFKVSILVPLVCLAGLVVWHLIAYLARKLVKNRKTVRHSLEPHQKLFHEAEPVQLKNDPERLRRVCAALVESLAKRYLELAESWLHEGQPQQAAVALRKIVQSCPETPQAQ